MDMDGRFQIEFNRLQTEASFIIKFVKSVI